MESILRAQRGDALTFVVQRHDGTGKSEPVDVGRPSVNPKR